MTNRINYPDRQRLSSISATAATGLGLGSAAILSGCSSNQNAIQLRKALGVMFPHSYIRLYHQPPYSVCSLFSFKQVALPTRGTIAERNCNSKNSYNYDEIQAGHHNNSDHRRTPWSTLVNVRLKPSSEPSSRVQVLRLQAELEKSLVAHQAKPVGLCPVRRAIYDQCFDEIIRQVTVGCIERGLLLFQIRNELRTTVNAYRRLYESAIGYKLGKLFDTNLQQVCNSSNSKATAAELNLNVFEQTTLTASNGQSHQSDRSISRLKEYYESELAKRDEIIRQQRAMMRVLNLNSNQPRE